MKEVKTNQKEPAKLGPSDLNDCFTTDENIFYKWLPTGRVVEEFFVSERTLYNWRKEGILPFGRLKGKGKIYYNRSVIEQILRNKWKVIPMFANLFLSELMNLAVGLECFAI